MSKIRVLVVDDSIFIRKTIVKLISNDEIEVIDTAVNGLDAIEKIKQLQPDVVTLDIEMPLMDGLTALKEIMQSNPVPILMLSTLTADGANATMEALSNGAVDFIAKKANFNELHLIKEELISKIMNISKSSLFTNKLRSKKHLLQMKRLLKSNGNIDEELVQNTKKEIRIKDTIIRESSSKDTNKPNIIQSKKPRSSDISIVVIGISTGGPAALQDVIPRLPADFPVPVLIAQHMPPFFTKSLADRLDLKSPLHVKEAVHGEKIAIGNVYFAPGGKQMTINSKLMVSISDEPQSELYKPSVNVMTDSVLEVYSSRVMGVMMTGMGHDGGLAFRRLNSKGGYIIVQDPESCVVAGMTKTVIDYNIANEIVTLNDIADSMCAIMGVKAL